MQGKKHRSPVIPIYSIQLALQRKYFSQLENIPTIYLYKHNFIWGLELSCKLSKNQNSLEEKNHIKMTLLRLKNNSVILLGW